MIGAWTREPLGRPLRSCVVVLSAMLALLPPRMVEADDQVAPDHIARAKSLLKEVEVPAWETDPLWQHVDYVLRQRFPVLRNAGAIFHFKAIFCHERLSPLERAHRLFTFAEWQHDAGLDAEALLTLDAVFDAAKAGYGSQQAPSMGYNANWAASVAHRLIQWNGSDEDVLRAVELGGTVRMHDPGMDFRYTRIAAESSRNALVARLAEQEEAAFDRARAWANAAIGYQASGDRLRAVAAAKRYLKESERVPPEVMHVALMDDWRLEVSFILAEGGDIEAAKQALRVADREEGIGLEGLNLAAAWLRIGERAEALARVNRFYEEIPKRNLKPDEEARMREQGWIIIASAYALRGDLEEADKALASIPAESQNRMRGVRFVGQRLLDRKEADSKQLARAFFTRHAPLATAARKVPDDENFGWLEQTVYCAMAAAQAGAIDAVEKEFLPTMTRKEQQTVAESLATYSTNLAIEERVRRFVASESDPNQRVVLLCLISKTLEASDELDHVERLIVQETRADRWKVAEAITHLAEHRQSLRQWDRAGELFELAITLTQTIEHKGRRAGGLRDLMVRAWLDGHNALARRATEQLIDLAWRYRDEPADDWDSPNRASGILAAKQLLEAL